MPVRFLLDENQRGVLWQVVQRHNAMGIDPLDVVRVGDSTALPLGVDDITILRWAEREERILVTFDRDSMPRHLADHLADGGHCAGLFILSHMSKPIEVLEFLTLVAYASEPAEWRDWIKYL